MEKGESLLDAIYEDEGDIEMMDVEEGEVVEEHNLPTELAKSSENGGGDGCVNIEIDKKKKNKRKKKRRRGGGPGPNVTDVNRFVLDVCRRLKEKKSYMVYTAVGCLGVSRLSDLVKEVDAVQSCGGQITTDGRRFRTGGGILWNILKTKEPKAYHEIMRKTKEFEKQFRQKNIRQAPQQNGRGPQQNKEGSSQEALPPSSDGAASSVPNDSDPAPQLELSNAETKHKSVQDRIRVPVSYDDLVGDHPKNGST